MRVAVTGDFRAELMLTHRYQEAFKKALPEDVEAVSRKTMLTVKRVMPVRTGRARATWGIFTPEYIVYKDPSNPIRPNESIWEVKDGGLTITQGADLRPQNYIDDLNAGSSIQAPAMFLDVIGEQTGDELVKAIDKRTANAI